MFNGKQRRRDTRRLTAARNNGVLAWSKKPARTTATRVKRQGKGNW